MKKALSLALMGMAMTAAVARAEVVYDFVPEVKNISFAVEADDKTNKFVDEVKIEVNFPTDVWWVEGYASQCYLLDSKGEKYDGWWPEFWGSASDYTRMVFEVRGLDKYVDADYTLVIPQGLLGDDTWNANHEEGRANPELRYEFNEWKLAGSPSAELEYTFVPQVESMIYQTTWDSEKEENVGEVRIDVKFTGDVWWVSGFSSQCYLLDSKGEKYEDWWPEFGGLMSDYSAMYFGVRGLSQYVDADYTLVIPQGLLGDTNWYNDAPGAKSNPELRYEFNPWKLAGCPRENFTVYDYSPINAWYDVEEARINGQKQLELQLNLQFPEATAVYKDYNNKVSVYDAEGEYIQNATVRILVDEADPTKVMVGLRGVDLKSDYDFTIRMWEGTFGTLEWAAEDYSESNASPVLEYHMNNEGAAVDAISSETGDSREIYTLQGVRVDSDRLSKGIYICNGKKIVVK